MIDLKAKLAGAPEVLEAIEKDPSFLANLENHRSVLTHGRFRSPRRNLLQVQKWGEQFRWPEVTADALQQAENASREIIWPENELVVVTLVPYLAAQGDFDGAQHTLRELWKAAANEQDVEVHWGGYDQPGKVRLLPGIEHTPGLCWEVIDVGCDRDSRPMDVRHPEHSPHAGIIATAAHHPEWVKAMDGGDTPYVWSPGHQTDPSGGGSWGCVPGLGFVRDDRRVGLVYGDRDDHDQEWAVPRFFREKISP